MNDSSPRPERMLPPSLSEHAESFRSLLEGYGVDTGQVKGIMGAYAAALADESLKKTGLTSGEVLDLHLPLMAGEIRDLDPLQMLVVGGAYFLAAERNSGEMPEGESILPEKAPSIVREEAEETLLNKSSRLADFVTTNGLIHWSRTTYSDRNRTGTSDVRQGTTSLLDTDSSWLTYVGWNIDPLDHLHSEVKEQRGEDLLMLPHGEARIVSFEVDENTSMQHIFGRTPGIGFVCLYLSNRPEGRSRGGEHTGYNIAVPSGEMYAELVEAVNSDAEQMVNMLFADFEVPNIERGQASLEGGVNLLDVSEKRGKIHHLSQDEVQQILRQISSAQQV